MTINGTPRYRKNLKARLLTAQEGRCKYCGASITSRATFDHVKPRALGGRNGASNLVLACPDCNRKKGCKPLHVWMQELSAGCKP